MHPTAIRDVARWLLLPPLVPYATVLVTRVSLR